MATIRRIPETMAQLYRGNESSLVPRDSPAMLNPPLPAGEFIKARTMATGEYRFVLNRDSGLPLYLQIAHEIIYQLQMGILRMGDRLPSIRKLSEKLRVSLITVDKAYRWLRSRGTITSRHGVGWRVVVPDTSGAGDDRSRIWMLKFVDEMLALAIDKGFDPMTIAQTVMHRAMAMERRMPTRKLVFIECHPEYVDDYTAELRRELVDLSVQIDGLLTTAISGSARQRKENLAILKDADFVMTTLYHYEFVQRFMAGLKRKAISLSHTIDKEALYKIVSIPPEMRVGAILGPTDPSAAIVRTLEFFRNLPPGSIPFAVVSDNRAVKKVQAKVDVIVYTAACKDRIDLRKNNILIRFVPDDEAIRRIRGLLVTREAGKDLPDKSTMLRDYAALESAGHEHVDRSLRIKHRRR